MTRVDWDAYFDGTMAAEQRAAIDRDPALSKERDGFAAFRGALRGAGLSERVPLERMERRLSAVSASQVRVPQPRWVLRSLPAVGALAALAWYLNRPEGSAQQGDPFVLTSPPVLEQMSAEDPVETATWVADRLGIAAPVIEAAGWRTTSVSVGKNWAAYELDHSGGRAVLQLATQDCFQQSSSVSIANRSFYQGREGLGWRDQGLSFYLNGCNSTDLRLGASTLMDAVKRAKRVGSMKKRKRAPRAVVKPM